MQREVGQQFLGQKQIEKLDSTETEEKTHELGDFKNFLDWNEV